jgi:hypothetical protein
VAVTAQVHGGVTTDDYEVPAVSRRLRRCAGVGASPNSTAEPARPAQPNTVGFAALLRLAAPVERAHGFGVADAVVGAAAVLLVPALRLRVL